MDEWIVRVIAAVVLETRLILWWVIGGCVATAAVIIVAITVWIYKRRKNSPRNKGTTPEVPVLGGEEFCHYKVPPSSYTSSGSEETISEYGKRRPYLMPSQSVDVPIQLKSDPHLKRNTLTRWHSVGYFPSVHIGTVQPDLYRGGSDDEEPSSPPCSNGRLWFSLLYHKDLNKLEVNLVKAKYLPGRSFKNTPRDPFVRIYLLPDEENFQQSKVRKRTLSPKFQEVFFFELNQNEVPKRTLRMSVYDVDKRKVRHTLGHVLVNLWKADLTSNEVTWRDLEKATQPSSRGEIQISLSCNPFTNRLKTVISTLRNIPGIDSGETDVYIRVQLFHGRKLLKTKKTNLKRCGVDKETLTFDDQFNFAISGRYCDSFNFNFTAFFAGSSPLVRDEPLGQVVLGPFLYARGEQLLHWQEMLSNPRSLVTRWHPLERVIKTQ